MGAKQSDMFWEPFKLMAFVGHEIGADVLIGQYELAVHVKLMEVLGQYMLGGHCRGQTCLVDGQSDPRAHTILTEVLGQ
jgi:hypothetical protein